MLRLLRIDFIGNKFSNVPRPMSWCGVKIHLIAEKPETLAMLQKDSHFLEKTLQDAGLTTDKDSLSFDLKQNNPQQQIKIWFYHIFSYLLF